MDLAAKGSRQKPMQICAKNPTASGPWCWDAATQLRSGWAIVCVGVEWGMTGKRNVPAGFRLSMLLPSFFRPQVCKRQYPCHLAVALCLVGTELLAGNTHCLRRTRLYGGYRTNRNPQVAGYRRLFAGSQHAKTFGREGVCGRCRAVGPKSVVAVWQRMVLV